MSAGSAGATACGRRFAPFSAVGPHDDSAFQHRIQTETPQSCHTLDVHPERLRQRRPCAGASLEQPLSMKRTSALRPSGYMQSCE